MVKSVETSRTPHSMTVTLASLAAGAGRQTTMVSNINKRFGAALVTVAIKTHTSAPTVGGYQVYLLRGNGTVRTDGAGASDAALSPKNAFLLGEIVPTPGAAAATYVAEFSTEIAGPLGNEWGILIVNSTDAALAASGSSVSYVYQDQCGAAVAEPKRPQHLAPAAFTITLADLAASATAGRQSTIVKNPLGYRKLFIGAVIETLTGDPDGTVDVHLLLGDGTRRTAGAGATNAALDPVGGTKVLELAIGDTTTTDFVLVDIYGAPEVGVAVRNGLDEALASAGSSLVYMFAD